MWWHPQTPLPYNEETWLAIFDLLSLPWFERVWVMQEIQLGNDNSVVFCGGHQIKWSLLRRSIICLHVKNRGTMNSNRELGDKTLIDRLGSQVVRCYQLCRYKDGESLPALLHSTRWGNCSEQIDRLYGILGLVPFVIAQSIHPDYHVPPSDAYQEVFLAHTNSVKRLELFDLGNPNRDNNTPSWVQDPTVKRHTVPLRADGFTVGLP